ncbi:hypothetical protein ACFQX6_51930 [Streptosporangium lutulentum]
MEQLKATTDTRGASDCAVRLSGAVLSATRHRHLDRLHRDALDDALGSVCTTP